ncbi:tetratricopeptide repeat protein [Candidatus Poribacteria bacterium]
MLRVVLFTFALCCVFLSQTDAQLVSIDIEDVQTKELYAVEYSLYTEEPIGTATIFNPTSEELRATVVLGGGKYINAPMKMTATLPPKQKTEIPLHIDLSIGVLDLDKQVEHVPVSIQIAAYLDGLRVFDSEEITRDVILHDSHKIPDGDPSKIAMFVDPGDKYVMSELSAGMGKTDEEKAAAAFELLQKKGIYCIGSGSAQIQYPRELLEVKFGSFYDCSFLYAAVLELLGVETKLMLNSDVALPFYKHEGEWHPVDVNMLSLNFESARSSGAKLQFALSSRDAQTVVLREAWQKYPPLQFPELDPADMSLLQSVDKYIEEERLADAAKIFEQLLERYPEDPVLLNNAANVDVLMGNMQQAVERYTRAVELSSDDGGLYLNMGIAYHKMGDEEKSMEALGKAYTKLGSYIAMRRELNLDEESRFYDEIDNLLRKAVRHTTEEFSATLRARSLTKSQYPLYWKRFR